MASTPKDSRQSLPRACATCKRSCSRGAVTCRCKLHIVDRAVVSMAFMFKPRPACPGYAATAEVFSSRQVADICEKIAKFNAKEAANDAWKEEQEKEGKK